MVLAKEQTNDQWDSIESPEINPQSINDKGGKNTQQGKNSLFSK